MKSECLCELGDEDNGQEQGQISFYHLNNFD